MKNLLFIHGAGNDGSVWDEVKKLLPDCNIYTPSLPGHANQPGKCESIVEYSRWIVDYINKNGLTNVILVGHSMGGAIAILTAAHFNKISALVIVGSGISLPVNPKILNGLKDFPMQTIKTIAKWSFSLSTNSKIKEKAIQMMIRNKNSLLNDFYACNEYDGTAASRKISVPALVTVGEADVMTPIDMANQTAEVLNADIIKIKNAGHMVQIENPEMLKEAIKNFTLDL